MIDQALRRRAVGYCVLVFVIARVALSMLGLAVGTIYANPPPIDRVTIEVPQVTAGVHNIFDGTERLDATWFIGIAGSGYEAQPEQGAAFFPGYPLVIRVVAALPGISPLVAAVIVSNLALLGALILLYLLTTRELTELIARRTVAVLVAFPTSFFLLAPYSESLFLLLTVITFASARQRRWGTSWLAGATAASTRLIGVTLAPALAFEAWRNSEGRRRWIGLLAACGVVVGPLLYFAWWQLDAGSFFEPIRIQSYWHRSFQVPIVSLARGLYLGWETIGAPDAGYWVSDAVLTSLALAGIITIWRRVPGSYLVFAVLSLLVPLSDPYPGRDLVSMSRFVLVIFPAFWGMGRWTQRRFVFIAWLLVSIPLAWWHALLFMHYRHIY